MANEKRLIDANEAKRRIIALATGCHSEVLTVDSVIMMLNQADTVDAVEVVNCKDCKHWHEETGWCYHHSHFIGSKGEACHPWESCDWKMLDADDFCSYGERRDNG